MIGSILGSLLFLVSAPLWAATSADKRKKPKPSVPKKVRLPRVKRPRVKQAVRRAVRAKPSHSAGKKKPAPPKKPIEAGRLKVVVKPAPVAKPEESEPPPKPVPPTGRAILLSPENEKFTDSVHPTFRWLSVGGATRYEVAWSEDPNFAQAHSIVSIATEATVPVEKPLRIGVAYHWHVRGGNAGGWGPWSASASFHVLTEPA